MKNTQLSKVSGRQSGRLSNLSRTKIITIAAFMLVFAGAGTLYIQNSQASTIGGYTCVNYKFWEYRFSGQCVKDIQYGLKQAGKYGGAIDGIYGPQTKSAVSSFGNAHGYNNNGQVGVRSWNDLCMLGSTWASDKFPNVAKDMGCVLVSGYYVPWYGRY